MEKHKKQRTLERDKMEKQLGQYTAKNQMTESELKYPLPFFRAQACIEQRALQPEVGKY